MFLEPFFAVCVCKYFCVNIFFLKSLFYALCNRSYHCTFYCRHGLVFELTHMCSSVEAHITHTLSTNAIERTYVQSIACVLNQHVTLFRSLSPLFPLISLLRLPSPPQLLHSESPSPPPKHFPITTTVPPCRRPSPPPVFPLPHFYISPFLPQFLTNPTSPKKPSFCPCF